MPSIGDAVAKYQSLLPRYQRAANTIVRIIEDTARESGVKCRVSGREKDISSFYRKAILKQYDDPWGQITDKAGVRAIVERAVDVDKLSRALRSRPEVKVIRLEDKRQVADPEQLGYSGVHLQVVAPPEDDDDEPVECEIQLRTIAQDAWSVVSHQLLYKPIVELPYRNQHALYRLVALVELFDEEVQRIMDSLLALPEYEVADLVEISEREFLPLTHASSSREFSAYILKAIQGVITPSDRADYARILHRFVEVNYNELNEIYQKFGPKGPRSSPDYALLGQAESLVVFHILTQRPHELVAAWGDAELPFSLLDPLLTLSDLDIDPLED